MYGADGPASLRVHIQHTARGGIATMTTLLITLDLLLYPWMKQQAGFVSSHWFLADDRRHCTIMVEFDSEPAASDVARATLALPSNQARSWNVARVDSVSDLDFAPRTGLRLEG